MGAHTYRHKRFSPVVNCQQKSSGVFLVIRGTTRGGAVECLSMPTHVRHVFLTGFPGVGKTTTMLAAIEDLGKVEDALTPEGFFTQEIRDEGKRVGFDVVTVGANPRRGPLARRIEDASASPRPRHRVGRYAVDVASLEALACPALSGDTLNPKKPARKRFVVLDEIGAMECLSDRFEHAAWLALESPTNVILGSMCVRAKNKNGKKHAFANAVAARPDVRRRPRLR